MTTILIAAIVMKTFPDLKDTITYQQVIRRKMVLK